MFSGLGFGLVRLGFEGFSFWALVFGVGGFRGFRSWVYGFRFGVSGGILGFRSMQALELCIFWLLRWDCQFYGCGLKVVAKSLEVREFRCCVF